MTFPRTNCIPCIAWDRTAESIGQHIVHLVAGRWPDDPVAFAKTKAALALQLCGSLESAHGYRTVASEDHVDVLMEGFAFRLLFHSGRDEAMLAKAESEALGQHRGGQSQMQSLHRNALVRSWHHGLVSSATGVNPAVAPTTRLARRWVEVQMLQNHMPEEAVELLAVAACGGGCTATATLPPPGSRLSGVCVCVYAVDARSLASYVRMH